MNRVEVDRMVSGIESSLRERGFTWDNVVSFEAKRVPLEDGDAEVNERWETTVQTRPRLDNIYVTTRVA